ncbi:hypothetical protein DVH24_009981 [Malus domestica]|uniref:HMA domain-containing protein n=2 Tax=Malus TaxID=3749 RepID=A0A498JRI7_MALDO|nr:hypothetical protein DVH24_009981 [Malus domestica]
MGVLDHFSDLFDCSGGSSSFKKRRQFQTVEIKVKMDCEGCERKVKRSVEGMKGVTQVDVERKAHKLTVIGYVDPGKVLARVAHRTGKKVEFWPYVPYDVVAHPYAAGVYDKKAPSGYVRNSQDPQMRNLARASSTEVRYTTAFSDENPDACVIIPTFGGKIRKKQKSERLEVTAAPMAEDQDQDSAVLEEEYAVWKKNSPFLYDLIISHPLEWPSLTVHWAPSAPQPHTDSSLAVHKLVLGTHTSDDYPNFLMVADALLPTSQPNFGAISENDPVMPKVEITQKIRVFGEVNRARWMPQKPTIVGAKTSGTDVYVFDCSKQEGKKHQEEACDPDLRLRGHDKEGYGLSWSFLKEGYLLSGSYDCKICLWDVSASAQEKVLDPIHVYERHESVVGDVSWHPKNENLFGSVGDDCQLMIWDLRTNQTQHCVKAHEKEVNYLSFNPYNEWILATASSDTTVGLFDMRNLTVPLHVLSTHGEEVFQVEWDPNHETVLASYADDRRLMVWDLNRIGDEQAEGDGDDGPPELLFVHGGHKAKISDFSWNKNEPWVISSVSEDNTLQVWQIADSIFGDDDDDLQAQPSCV